MTWSVLHVDDEPPALRVMAALLGAHPDFELVASMANAAAARARLEQGGVDVLFADVHMPGLDGLALLRGLARPPLTVLVTATRAHALAAFELGVRDYLLKPVAPDRLAACIARLRQQLGSGTPAGPRVSIRCGPSTALVDVRTIQYVAAVGDYSQLQFEARDLVASESLKVLEQRLAPHAFVRVHKSFVVNADAISTVCAGRIVLRSGRSVPIGRAYRDAVRALLTD